MQIRCQRCSYMFTLSQESVVAALEEIEQSDAKHYNIECPKCRRQIKVPVREIQRFPAAELDRVPQAKSQARGKRHRTRKRKQRQTAPQSSSSAKKG